jgi:hypothetical protein
MIRRNNEAAPFVTCGGAIPVERLHEGYTVLTISGKLQTIQWIGCRTLDCNRHISPERVKPIRIAPHAFGENRPKRALLLSPDHSAFVEDVLIPLKHLINNTTVTQIDIAAGVAGAHAGPPGKRHVAPAEKARQATCG